MPPSLKPSAQVTSQVASARRTSRNSRLATVRRMSHQSERRGEPARPPLARHRSRGVTARRQSLMRRATSAAPISPAACRRSSSATAARICSGVTSSGWRSTGTSTDQDATVGRPGCSPPRARTYSSVGTMTFRRKTQTSVPSWLWPRVSTVTTPRSDFVLDGFLSSTVVSA